MPEEEGMGIDDYLVNPTPVAPTPGLPNVVYRRRDLGKRGRIHSGIHLRFLF